MNPIIKKYKNAIVIDHFLPSETFERLSRLTEEMDYTYAAKTKWQKQYDIVETPPLEGPVYFSKPLSFGERNFPSPSDEALQQFVIAMHDRIKLIEEMIYPEKTPWDVFGIRPFLYARGSSLGWHTDGAKAGAYTYYLHSEWKADWGGELCVLECEPGAHVENSSGMTYPSELTQYDVKQFFPLPNRLVIIRGGSWHRVARIEAAAGSHLRRAISGFFFDSKQMAALLK